MDLKHRSKQLCTALMTIDAGSFSLKMTHNQLIAHERASGRCWRASDSGTDLQLWTGEWTSVTSLANPDPETLEEISELPTPALPLKSRSIGERATLPLLFENVGGLLSGLSAALIALTAIILYFTAPATALSVTAALSAAAALGVPLLTWHIRRRSDQVLRAVQRRANRASI